MAERRKSQPMTKGELLAVIAQYEKDALGSDVNTGPTVGGNRIPPGQQLTTLELDRYNALNAYMGRPMGNEVPGRSQVVIPELRDTVDWVVPQLVRIFAATQRPCRFTPDAPDDEEQAELETDVANYYFMERNRGMLLLHDLFKDALLLRNGYARVYWEEGARSAVESYSGLTEMELTQLLQPGDPDEDVEVLEQLEDVVIDEGGVEALVFDVRLRRRSVDGFVRVEALPPEEVLVSTDARWGTEDAAFWEHKRDLPKSDLLAQGYSRELLDSVAVALPDYDNLAALARDETVDQLGGDITSDKSMQRLRVRHVEMRVDYDGDGMAERRRIVLVGDQIAENEEIDEYSIVALTALRMPHRHVGMSYYDLLSDLQAIKTTLVRQALDNLYLQNNSRTAINWRTVNESDLLVSRPGGIVRVDGPPSQHIMPLEAGGQVMAQALPALEYLDKLRELRTGVGHDTMGLDADALANVTKGGQLAAMGAAGLKVELVARLLAEGVRDIFRKVHAEVCANQRKPLQLQLAGKWHEIDPSLWKARRSVAVEVGLGSGVREEARANFAMLTQMQGQLAHFGLVGPKQAFESFKRGAQIIGIEDPERYAMDPDSPEFAQWQQQHPPQPPPQVEAAKIRAQTDVMRAHAQQSGQVAHLQSQLAQSQASEQSERLRAAAEMVHAEQQTAAAVHGDIAQTLIKVIGEIVAQQLKQQPQINAGETLAQDVTSAEHQGL